VRLQHLRDGAAAPSLWAGISPSFGGEFMRLDDRARLHCACVTAAACVAVSVAVPASAGSPAMFEPSRATAGRCPLADATPEQASARRLAGALRCLVNRQRRRRGAARLHDAPALDRVARRFAEDMRRRGYFSHVSPTGRRLRDRVRSVGLQASGEVLAAVRQEEAAMPRACNPRAYGGGRCGQLSAPPCGRDT
jgi:hypothetical protein